MIDWSKGYSAKYILTVLDKDIWGGRKNVEMIDGTIDHDESSDTRQSATVSTSKKIGDGEEWIRISLLAKQDGEAERVDLFTGITSMPERSIDGTKEQYTAECYSVLKPCEDVAVLRGYYAPIGSGAITIKELLSDTPAPVVIEGESPVTTSNIVAEDGATKLSMALQILDVINWRIRISGDGTVTICEKSDEPVATFDARENDIIEPQVTDTDDWYSCPNCYMAMSDDAGSAVARDDDPDSMLSTETRGREVWTVETGVELSSSESIAEYAQRRLKELQNHARTLKYSRRFKDGILPTDVVNIGYARQSLNGLYRITTQSMELGYGCSISEEVESIE